MEPQQNKVESVIAPLKKVTPLSKYLAMILFIAMPFIGGWIGYTYAPEKVQQEINIDVSTSSSTVKVSTSTQVVTNSHQWNGGFEKKQLAATYTEENFLTETGDETKFISLSDSCKQYMGGDECVITVLPNDYGLVPGSLERKKGPFQWHTSDSLVEVRVMENGKLLLVWGFGDGGASSRVFSVWDTKAGKHLLVSSYGGLMREIITVSANITDKEKTFSVLAAGDPPYVPEGAVNVFDRDMFESVRIDGGEERPDYCIDVNLTPKDRANPIAPWLLEYTYGCEQIGEDVAFRYYELDPMSGQMKSI